MTDNQEMSAEAILAIPMQRNDARAETIGGYLAALLRGVLQKDECFDGKRPFGNSGWLHEPMKALIQAGAMPGTLDEDGYVDVGSRTDMLAVLLKALSVLEPERPA